MMDIRDYFATKVMQSFLNQPLPEGHSWNMANIAKSSYEMADEMMKAREQNATEL